MRAELAEFVGAVEASSDLDALLSDGEIDARLKIEVLRDILAGADELVLNFVLLLAEKGRAGDLREVAAEFESLVAEEDRVLDVELTTAHELSEADFETILAGIEEKSGRKVQATRAVDPELIGGIILQAGSLRLDASVRGSLERLRQELVTTRS